MLKPPTFPHIIYVDDDNEKHWLLQEIIYNYLCHRLLRTYIWFKALSKNERAFLFIYSSNFSSKSAINFSFSR